MSRQRSFHFVTLLLIIIATGTLLLFTGCPWGNPNAGADIPGLIQLPRTGQTTSYATGDDGDLQMGVPWPAPRFTDNGNGTITDGLTGLMWDQTGDRFSNVWASTLTDIDGLSLGGKADWRLPNENELRSLINSGVADSAAWLTGLGFSNLADSNFYTSTTYAPLSTFAWGVRTGNSTGYGLSKTGTNRPVLAVRGLSGGAAVELPETGQITSFATNDDGDLRNGVAWPNPRFTDNGDGTITDELTGLMWDKNGNRFTSTWSQALSDAAGLSLGGFSDWRLPNVVEMMSLINREQTDNAAWLITQGFTNVQLGSYWTSTTDASLTTTAWAVATDDGDRPQADDKSSSYPILLVRGG